MIWSLFRGEMNSCHRSMVNFNCLNQVLCRYRSKAASWISKYGPIRFDWCAKVDIVFCLFADLIWELLPRCFLKISVCVVRPS